MHSLLTMLVDVPPPGSRPAAADVAPSPADGGPGTVAAVLIALAVIVAGVLFFRWRRRRS